MAGTNPANRSQRSSGSIRTSLWIFREPSYPGHDADRRRWRSYFLWNFRNGASHRTFQVQKYTVW